MSGRPASTAAEVVAAFRRFWRAELMKPGGPRGAAEADALVSNQSPSVKRVALRAHRALVRNRLGTRDAAILYGAARALDRDGDGWELIWDGLLGPGLAACVDASDGRVLLVWRTPEG